MVKIITQYKKIPIIIGGGHNNAYPAIKGAAKGLYKAELLQLAQINCINLDAHADYRPLEGRHSGNAFRYADEDGYLNKYCVVGIHENCITYEDIFIHEKRNFIQAIAHATGFTEDNYTGVELDLDVIENILTSASTPSGLSALHARQYINFVATDAKIAYVHICEGATRLDNGETNSSTGKLISYLVSDFVKSHSRIK
jgi:formiminoglutamase